MSVFNTIKNLNSRSSKTSLSTGKYWYTGNGVVLLKRAFLELIQIVPESRLVLDVGAGHQTYKPFVEARGHKYLVADLYPRSVPPDLISDVQELAILDSSVDLAMCMQVLEHVPRPWVAIKELARVVRPGGHVIISVPHLAYIHNAPHDYFRFTHYGIRILAEEAGLEVVQVKSLGGLFSFLGQIRSTALLSLMNLFIIGDVLFWINYYLVVVETKLDKLLGLEKLFPLNYIGLFKKSEI